MKIAIFTDTYLPAVDGVVNSIRNTKRGLEERGHRVLVFAPGGKKATPPPDTLYTRGRELRSMPGYHVPFIPTRRELTALAEYGPDVVHAHGFAFMGLKGMWASRELFRPMILTFHTMIIDALPYYLPFTRRSRVLTALLSRYLRAFLHHSGAVVTPSQAVLDELRVLAPRMRRTAVIPNGVDLDRFRTDLDGTAVREKHGLEEAEILLHVGRVAPEKDIAFLLRAFPGLLRQRPGTKLLFVGTGPELERCQRFVHRHGLTDDILFTGFVPDEELPSYYAAADVMTIASKFETQGMVVLEAMACGKPVVAVDYRAFPEYIEDGHNGFLFPPGDVPGFHLSVLSALDCEDGVRERARETAQRFSWDQCTEKLVALYEEMAAQA
ncbi:MAG: glycosyltransferase [Candidatus Thermoplasmatota archaeon]|nr:glycosyltransferase [Candidatus Thermoplasmatota archaeon]